MYFALRQRKEISLSLGKSLVKNLIIADYYWKGQLLSVLSKLLFKNRESIAIKKILILRIGGMGDTLTALAAFSAIKKNYPEAQIDLLSPEPLPGRNAPSEILPKAFIQNYYYYHSFVDQYLTHTLKSNAYDLFIELPTYFCSLYFELRSVKFAKTIHAKSAIGWHISSTGFLKKYQEDFFIFDTNRVRQVKILHQYRFPAQDTGYLLEQYPVVIPAFDKETFPEISNGTKIVVLVPGAGRPQNKWPISNFDSIARYFSAKGYTVCLVGGLQNFEDAQSLCQNRGVINYCGKLSILENASLFRHCSLVVSNDTGPMHLAYASGAPVIAIFSARDYRGKWFPPDDGRNIVFRGIKEIGEIKPEMVIEAADKLLSRVQG